MDKLTISIIAAIGSNRELGKDNKLLWHIPEDLKRFKELTLNHPVIMGRKTFESIGHVLHGRTNIVVTRDKNYQMEGCLVAHSLEDAIKLAKGMPAGAESGSAIVGKEIFIIGGGQIYQQAINIADKLYLTVVKGKYEADTFFPDYSRFKTIISQKTYEDNRYDCTFLELKV
ncbi:diacylglycerol kinase [Candidatus Gottesmanbacteria bacterium RIFCSPLOWO2_01_FULL_39_12b]|uniref:Dihydrofolate reductase n=1 Tax=Candidatus Gottesmanbacteria bacterium RIFCSPLOWO2_01_FULL_39_12b TaxID=1798388 RepID=A0A1F6AP64_9BACT|nr:MAG: diacylglycerol kinase [Candidatus Gottesmanbacteria bacterium RIFCSPLOWO2_01_FULL_39_12b]